METLLQVQEICKYYRMGEVQITAVDHVSFSVEKGEFVVIVGVVAGCRKDHRLEPAGRNGYL